MTIWRPVVKKPQEFCGRIRLSAAGTRRYLRGKDGDVGK